MARLILVHWNSEEAAGRAQRLRDGGHSVDLFHDAERGKDAQRWRENPPDAFVIDLSRLPSHGTAIGGYIREVKALRSKPIVFVGGEPDKVKRTKQLLPDAAYTDWTRIRSALRRAIAHPPAAPVKIQSTSGYSGTPLPKKLGIKPSSTVALLGAPEGFRKTLGALPDQVKLIDHARGKARTILLFITSAADLAKRFPAAARSMDPTGSALWVAWPKKSSGVPCDLGENEVRAFGLARGVVDYKICAIDQTWSGLCFARRKTKP